MNYMMGIDIGTQSVRTYLYDENANCVCAKTKPQYVDTPKPMWITQKADYWWLAVKQNIQEILAETGVNPQHILSIGCCAHMHGPVPVQWNRRVVQNDIQLYSDKRAASIAEGLRADGNFEQIYEMTANPPTSNWFGIKIKWLQQNEPVVYEAADHFLTPKDYINFMFTGEACIDPSEASGSYLMDRKTDAWSDVLIRNLGIDRGKLPKICGASQMIGTVCAEAAKETGLSQKTVVVCGGGDMLCSLYTSGLNRQGNVVDLTGTGSVICYYAKDPILDKRIMNLRHVIDGWVPFGNIDSSGGAFRWLRDNLAKEEASYAKKNGMDDYAYLCQLAKQTPPGADGLLFMPYLMGERTMGSANSRGCFVGMNLGTTTGHLVRALLEGVAFEHKRTLDVFAATGAKMQRVFHISGGSKGQLWNQIKADVYGLPVYTLKIDEGGVVGAALLGGVAVGLFQNELEAAEVVTQIAKEYLPDRKKTAYYNEVYQAFCEVHDALQKPFTTLAKVNAIV